MPLDRRTLFASALAGLALPVLRSFPVSAGAAVVSEVAPGIFVHQGRHELFSPSNAGDIANPGFVVGATAVAVIDTGGSPRVGASLREAVSKVTDRPVRYVINTHMHPDHVFGNVAFEGPDVAFVGHHKLARGLAARQERYLAINREALGEAAFAGTKIILPGTAVMDKVTLDLGGRTIVCEAHPTAHTDNDLTVRDSATDTWFMGDLIFAGHTPTLDGSIKGWLTLLRTLSDVGASRIVPGHGPAAMPWPDAAQPITRYLDTVATDVRALIKEGRTLEDATETAGLSEKGAWELFEEYHKRNVSAAFAELEWE